MAIESRTSKERHIDVAAPQHAPNGDVMVFLKGSAFRCDCGCNVFRHPDGEPMRYRCNSCGATYSGH